MSTIRHVLTPTTQPSIVLPKYTRYNQACSHSNHSTIHGFTPVYRMPSGMFSFQPSMVSPQYTGYHQACSHSNHSTIHGFTLVYRIPSGMFSFQPLNHPWVYPSIHYTIRHVFTPTTQPSMVLPRRTGYKYFCYQPINHPWFYLSIQDIITHILTPTTQPSMFLPKYTGYHQACSHSNRSTIHGFTQIYRIPSGMFSLQPLNHPWFYPSIQGTIRHVLTPTTQASMVLSKYTRYHQNFCYLPLNHSSTLYHK
jgi:hypothetical protein